MAANKDSGALAPNGTYCLVLRDRRLDDTRFRPPTWAAKFFNPWAFYTPAGSPCAHHAAPGVDVVEEPDAIAVQITPEHCARDPASFERLLRLARDNQLTYELPDMELCAQCKGHPACLAHEHLIGGREGGRPEAAPKASKQ
jgi:hypothetical protein